LLNSASVWQWLANIRENIGFDATAKRDGYPFANAISNAARNAIEEQLGQLEHERFADALRAAADHGSPKDITDEERDQFRSLANALEESQWDEGFDDALRELVESYFNDLFAGIEAFRRWAERHEMSVPPARPDLTGDLVDIKRDEDGEILSDEAQAAGF
jgi:hypothetical protein